MKKKTGIGLLLLSLFFMNSAAFGQNMRPEKKGKLIGFGFGLTDFYTPTKIKNSSLGDVLDGTWTKLKDHDPALSLMYWQGITKHLDYSVRYNMLMSDYSKSSLSQDIGHELEGAFHLRAFKDNRTLNPFLTAGAGIGTYGKTWVPYSPLGIGLQLNLASTTYLFLQGNYRLSYIKHGLDNNLMYSLGITENISPSKEREIKAVPIPAVEKQDRDNDGVEDDKDECPDVPGLASLNGCPDSDGDGVADKDDKCPQVAGLAKYDGCPIPDSDGDGVNDEEDKCPDVPGVAKYGGCPIPDTDGDGINDEEDKCPNLPGVAANNGCPEIKEETKKKINYSAQRLYFATGSAKLLSSSYAGLNEVVKILNEDKNLRLSVEGHTDNTGSAEKNQILSEQRAQSVVDYLVSKGIDASRLDKAGYGQDKPIASNATAAGRTKNRRVEMNLSY